MALRIHVHLQPRAAHTRIVGRHGDSLKVQVQAPPVDGAANAALTTLVAETFGVSRRAVRIVQGEASRDKVVEVDLVDTPSGQRQLAQLMSIPNRA